MAEATEKADGPRTDDPVGFIEIARTYRIINKLEKKLHAARPPTQKKHESGSQFAQRLDEHEALVAKLTDHRAYYRAWFDACVASYQKEHGRIIDASYSKNHRTAIVLTDSGHVEAIDNMLDGSREEALFHVCLERSQEACDLLEDAQAYSVNQTYFSIAKHAISINDRQARPDKKLFKLMDERIESAHARAHELHQRFARSHYVVGLLAIGVPVWGVVLGLAAWIYGVHDLPIYWWAILGGGIGTVLSVLSRLHMNRLEIKYNVPRAHLWFFGSVRVLVGILYAIAIAGIVEFDIVSPLREFTSEHGDSSYWMFGFFAGFAERWSRETLFAALEK